MSYFYGVYNLDLEIYYAELCLNSLFQKDFDNLTFINSLFEVLNAKCSHKCEVILAFDVEHPYLLEVLSRIFKEVLINCLQNP